jgi:hypothetical protein
MFGMLDYRAHKLCWILYVIPVLILGLFQIFGLPLTNYFISHNLFDERIWQVITSIISIIILEIIWITFITYIVAKVGKFTFELIIDVIPDDGRTKEEAWMVVLTGKKAITALKIGTHPKTWDDELMEDFINISIYQKLFFKNQIMDRLDKTRKYFMDNPQIDFNEFEINSFLKENNLTMGMKETIITSPIYKRWIISYTFFLYLIIFNPSGL